MPSSPSARRWWALPTAIFILTRIWLLAIPFGLLPYQAGTRVINDITLYEQWARLLQSGQFPVNDQMWQYPPLIGPVLALGALIPPDPTLGLVLLMLAFDTATFVVLMRAVARGAAIEGVWVWIAAAMLVGPVWLTRFDVVPSLFAVLALLAINRPVRSGIMMAIGALIKVWPALLLISVPRRSFGKALIAFLTTGLALLVTLSLTMQGVGSFASEQRARGLQVESIPAWLFLVGHHLGLDRTFIYRYGAMEVEAPGTRTVAAAIALIGLVGLALLAVARLTGRLDHASPADIAMVVVLFSMVTSRVLSPQYLVWVAAIAAVCLLDPATTMRPIVTLLMPVAALGQILYPMHYDWLFSDGLTGLAIQTVRVVLLVAATVWASWRLIRPGRLADPVRVEPVEQVGQTA
ncbi:MAG: glycosyltransferase 87 family protein [Candidatus Nanopelagicales bacterium]